MEQPVVFLVTVGEHHIVHIGRLKAAYTGVCLLRDVFGLNERIVPATTTVRKWMDVAEVNEAFYFKGALFQRIY